MFESKETIKELKSRIKNGKEEVAQYRRRIEDLEREIMHGKEDHQRELKTIEAEHRFKIETFESTQLITLKTKLSQEEAARKIAEAKATIIEKAFGELGFDVKDTKEMIKDLITALGNAKSANVTVNSK